MKKTLIGSIGAAVLSVALVALPAYAAGTNGSFETGISVPGDFTTINAVDNLSIDGWSVDSGSVDYINTYWLAANGSRSIDLDGNSAGTISQTFPTTIGTQYKVTFSLSGNSDNGASDKTVRVTATGAPFQDYTFNTALNSRVNMMWESHDYTFTATAASTALSFASLTEGAYGPALDNVVITEVVPECNANATHTVVSDETTYNNTDLMNAVLAWIHPNWSAVIPGASWIWATNPTVTVANTDVTKTFTKAFTIVGVPTSGTLNIAADNSYTAKVNGHDVPVVFDQNNFELGTQDSYNVGAWLVSGTNTIEVTVTNWGVGQSVDPFGNPAGLLFGLTFVTNECVVPPTTGTISGQKYNDLNRNGKKDVGEPGLQGWVIRLILDGPNDTDTLITTATTDADGNYTFTDVAPGTYDVRETHQKGWKRMSKNPADIIIEAGDAVTGVDFGNALKKKSEKDDTDKDDNRDDQHGSFHAHGHSDYGKDSDKKENKGDSRD